jgi:hypothetical protein
MHISRIRRARELPRRHRGDRALHHLRDLENGPLSFWLTREMPCMDVLLLIPKE